MEVDAFLAYRIPPPQIMLSRGHVSPRRVENKALKPECQMRFIGVRDLYPPPTRVLTMRLDYRRRQTRDEGRYPLGSSHRQVKSRRLPAERASIQVMRMSYPARKDPDRWESASCITVKGVPIRAAKRGPRRAGIDVLVMPDRRG